ncbi:GH92 family glycosyl hydrolase [Flavimarina sp. Hel_I_48]|uniref:GH92 family glycosyl hydrolase n=1 Tax=Flavimarina sp. Hel_I_48 TaxID=1392488 RepID=UPI0004DF74F2|nr:GH92 family glycosyl hydrolase [Flavimarina sp. Hel_I_48]
MNQIPLKITLKQAILLLFLPFFALAQQSNPVDYVNPFIGTSNYGATNPGAIAPRGMASVSPFNVAGRIDLNPLEKDSQWLSNPYVHENKFLTGFSQVNMSGVGCPDLGVILAMPITGELETDYLKYGTTYRNEEAKAGYYSVELEKYNIKSEATATTRTGVSRYSFPAGKAHILLNLGLGLTNEQGAMLKVVSPSEIEGMRMVGAFCYNNAEAAYPIYFVARVSRPAADFGIWKTPVKYEGTEAKWMTYNGKTRVKQGFMKEVVGDSIGAFFSYNFDKPQQLEMKVGVSYVSIENARENLNKETENKDFDAVYAETEKAWNEKLSRIEVEGDSEEDKTIFYTALYHTQIHPNILNDVNGEYPIIGSRETSKTEGTRYTTFSLWDTYRNYHQLMSLIYPEEQLDMVKSMLDMYDENGWLPKWELNSTETFTMVGDPASAVIADTYLRGITDFDVEKAYEAMLKSADQTEGNPLRPGLAEYIENGYVSLDSDIPGPVSTTQEYNIADYAIAKLAQKLGKTADYKRFSARSGSYKRLFNKESGFLQPKHADGSWMKSFDPLAGANFTENPGFIEGNAWQYLFMQPHDIKGMVKLMGGDKSFEQKLDDLFSKDQFDMANEPDFAYPFLYNFIPGKAHKASEKVSSLIDTYYKNAPDGIPGNDDTGTMSAWVVYAMMGIYPMTPAEPSFTLVKPRFPNIKIHLNPDFYGNDVIEISSGVSQDEFNVKAILDGKNISKNNLSHEMLIHGKNLSFKALK